jgi:hypothetical protein
MSDTNNVRNNLENVNENFEQELKLKKLREEVLKRLTDYRKMINFMAADAPISILCLKPAIEKALLSHGCLRVYDLFDVDFTEVKGLGVTRIRDLTTCLDKFLSML